VISTFPIPIPIPSPSPNPNQLDEIGLFKIGRDGINRRKKKKKGKGKSNSLILLRLTLTSSKSQSHCTEDRKTTMLEFLRKANGQNSPPKCL